VVTEKPGDRVAATSCSSRFGEGGCGVSIWPSKRNRYGAGGAQVIKLGMDTKSVIARFGGRTAKPWP